MRIDLFEFDKRVARVHANLVRDTLATEADRERARMIDPFGELRDVAGQATFHALAEVDTLAVDHRDALRRWVHELLQARISRDLFIDEADAIHAIDADRPTELTFAAALRRVREAPDPALAEDAFARLDELAPSIAAVRKEIRARRFEAARRLELEHPWALLAPRAALENLARAILDATEPLARALRGDVGPAQVIRARFARDAREGWPANLGKRWLDDLFRSVAPRSPAMPAQITPLGGASFVLAADIWGRALRQASVPRALPFALARDPYPTAVFTFGGIFAMAMADRVFAKRRLGLVHRAADAHYRALGRVLFTELRRRAAELLGLFSIEAAPELAERVFGRALSPGLGEVWASGGFSGASRIDAPARLIGAVHAFELGRTLVERFDEDWFDNPRAGGHLANIGSGPVHQPLEPHAADLAKPIARAFEERLG